MKDEGSEKEWRWPLNDQAYDRTITLSNSELSFLAALPKARITYSEPQAPELAAVSRLIEPLDDVFTYIDVRKAKRNQLLPLLLEQMRQRRLSFWGWRDQDWIEIIENHRHFAGWLIAVAYLLCNFRSLDAFPKRRQVFSGLAGRVFGSQRFAFISGKAQQDLAALGYKERTLRLVPITIAQLLLSIRSPHMEGLTIDVLREFQKPHRTLRLKNV